MGYKAKRIGLIITGIIVGFIVIIPIQMIMPFPNGLYLSSIVLPIIITIFLVIAFVVIKSPNGIGQSPLSILNERYAKGEITKEEFENMKKDLENS